MSIVTATPLNPCYDIKSADLPLLSIQLKSTDLHAIQAALQAQLAGSPGFFEQDPVVVDLSALELDDTCPVIDFQALIQLLKSHGLVPLAVKGAEGMQRSAALSCGLVEGNDLRVRRTMPQAAVLREEQAPNVQEGVPPPQLTGIATLVIDKPLRSGQQVYAKGGDLIVLAMVNAGAEVIADGNIHIYAPLRGKAIAGARGNTQARIFALAMEPELVSIAGIYRTSDKEWGADVHGRPAQVRLQSGPDGDKLWMQALTH